MAKQYVKNDIKETVVALLRQMPLKDISVKMVVEKCEINRNTFYYYYEDIYGVIKEFLHEQSRKMAESYDENRSLEDNLAEAIEHLFALKEIIANIYCSASHNILYSFFRDYTDPALNEYIARLSKGRIIEPEKLKTVSDFCQQAVLGVVISWLETGMQDSFRQDMHRTAVLLESIVERIMDGAEL